MSKPFFSGLTFWYIGWKKLLTTKSLFTVALTPVLISLLFFGTAIYLVVTYVGGFVGLLMGWLPVWLSWLDLPLTIIFGLLFAAVVTYFLYMLHMIIAIPFYSLLADRTLRARGVPMPKGMSLRVLRASVLKTILFLFFGIILFGLSFLPGMNIAVIGAALLILAADIMDYSFEAMGMGLRDRVKYLGAHFSQVAGMATALSVTLIIPGLALLLTPGAVVGAALSVDSRGGVRHS